MTDRRGRARGLFNRRWDLVEVFVTTRGQNRHLEGKSVEQIAKEQNKGVMDALLDLSLERTCRPALSRSTAKTIRRSRSTSPARNIPSSAPATVAAGRTTADRHETSTQLPGYWVREQQVMPLEEAVYRLTGKTALCTTLPTAAFSRQGHRHHDLRPRHDRAQATGAARDLAGRRHPGEARRGRHRQSDRQRHGAARKRRADRSAAARPGTPMRSVDSVRTVFHRSRGIFQLRTTHAP